MITLTPGIIYDAHFVKAKKYLAVVIMSIKTSYIIIIMSIKTL